MNCSVNSTLKVCRICFSIFFKLMLSNDYGCTFDYGFLTPAMESTFFVVVDVATLLIRLIFMLVSFFF